MPEIKSAYIVTKDNFRPIVATIYQLELQDYVMFTSRDFGRLQVTEKNVISNYALTYAFGRAQASENGGQFIFPKSYFRVKPDYSRDFNTLHAYVTPALVTFSWLYKKVYNTIPEIYADRAKPMYGKVVPSYGRYDMIGIGSQFVFVVLWEDEPKTLPRYIRLGRFLGTAELTFLAKCGIREHIQPYPFHSLPLHLNDVPANLSVIPHNLIRIGKGHAILLNAEFNCPFWELEIKEVHTNQGRKMCLGDGLPKGVFYCARTTTQNRSN